MPTITISCVIKAPVNTTFESYLSPVDNLRWNTAGEGWTTNYAKIDPIKGGEFHIGYKSPDEKNDFDLGGTYLEIIENNSIISLLGEDRKIEVNFEIKTENEIENTLLTITFDVEDENSIEPQKQGWSKILDNFKNFVERKTNLKNTTITKTTEIKATKEKVWQMLLQEKSYRKWTSFFMEGSYYEGEMKYDGKIKFLSPSGSGISSKIVVFIPGYQVSFEHLEAIVKDKEDFDSSEFEGWKGARETYTLEEKDGIVNLEIYVELIKNQVEEMGYAWDKALEELKKLCEE